MDSIDELDFSKTYTYADYYPWRFPERVELIKGKVFKMVNYPDATCRYTLDKNGKYTAGKILTNGDKLSTPILPGFKLTMDTAFHKVRDFRNLIRLAD